MHRALTVALVAVAGTVATPAPAEAQRSCPDYGGQFAVTGVTASGASCKTAKRVIRKYERRTSQSRKVGRFTCRARPAPEGFAVRCKAPGKTITWNGQGVG